AKARVKRVVVVGLDGLEPSLTEQMMEEGLLPNLKRLQEAGSYRRLGTTWPPLSPVAWSSFTTGSNPGKHNIFDFIDRTPSYAPTMSSVRLREAKPRKLLGIIPWGGGTDVVGMRKSKPFWTVLGEHGVFSSILRVPITYPPDKFNGVQLSAMCVPDLRGTLGLFTYYTDRGADADLSDGGEGGEQIVVQREGDEIRSYLRGPANPASEQHEELRIPFRVTIGGKNADATLHVDGEKTPLRVGKFSGFVSVTFNAGVGKKLNGIARFYLKSLRDPFELYCSPIQIDPDRPVLPISHPMVYSSYLARTQGPFYTLGLAEDTGALDRSVLDEDAFLQHCYDIHEEREKMFFDALAKTRRGAVVCVFDGPDRIQHMFWRFHDDQHPAVPDERRDSHRHVIRQMYQRMDELVGRVMQKLDPDTALFVMSDHGFKTFRRGVDLNAWLRDNGYLKLKDGRQVSEKSWLADIDWEHTRAFALGLAGIFINQKGRESKGIVAPGEETKKLVAELCEKLTGLKDPAFDRVAIREALPREKAYKGPYTQNAPDILVGYAENYRVSWDAAVGKASADVFSDNMKAWSGDHCVHPEIAPGVLFSNTRLREGEASIVDVGPTALDLFGIPTPRYMDGKSLLCTEAA
ncbi:MAG: nucleotide pyrophosphatase, partial [Planctomycetota bacterium]